MIVFPGTFLSSLSNQTHTWNAIWKVIERDRKEEKKSRFLHVNLHIREISTDNRVRGQSPPLEHMELWSAPLQELWTTSWSSDKSYCKERTMLLLKCYFSTQVISFWWLHLLLVFYAFIYHNIQMWKENLPMQNSFLETSFFFI